MKYEPELTYQYASNVSKEEAERKVAKAYDELFKATIEDMKKSPDEATQALLRKFE